jgi:hypothetical protein
MEAINEPDWAIGHPVPENDNLESLAQKLDELAREPGNEGDSDTAFESEDGSRRSA